MKIKQQQDPQQKHNGPIRGCGKQQSSMRTMQWSTMGGFMQELSLMVIDEGQQYGTDSEIAVISLMRQQPLVLWTGDSEQTPADAS